MEQGEVMKLLIHGIVMLGIGQVFVWSNRIPGTATFNAVGLILTVLGLASILFGLAIALLS